MTLGRVMMEGLVDEMRGDSVGVMNAGGMLSLAPGARGELSNDLGQVRQGTAELSQLSVFHVTHGGEDDTF